MPAILATLARAPREVWLILAAIIALWAWGNHREGQGRATERAAWEQEAARLRGVAAQEAARRIELVTKADELAAAQARSIASLSNTIATNRRAFYAARPDADISCLDDDRVRAVASSDAAAIAALAAR